MRESFRSLQGDVSHESVAHHHVGCSLENVVTLDIPKKIQTTRSQQVASPFDDVVPLDVFGQIAGDPQSLVVLSADPAGTLRGIAQQGKKLWILAGGAAAGGPRLGLASREVAQCGGLTGLPPFQCGVEGRMQELTAPPLPRVNALPIAPLPAGQFYQVPVAIETDGEFYNLFGSSSAATSYIGDLFAYASVIYNREASAKLVVGNITLWSGGADSDPWNHANTEAGLYSFQD